MELSMNDLKELLSMNTGSTSSPEERPKSRLSKLIGKNLLIRTVTMTYTGNLVEKDGEWLVLKQAAWIPDSGRWHVAVRDAEFSEVEMYPADKEVYVNAGAVTDFTEIPKLPTETK